MKKTLLLGASSFLLFLLSISANATAPEQPLLDWTLAGPKSAYFTWINQELSLVPAAPAAYASILPTPNPVAFTTEDLASVQPLVEKLLTNGFTLHIEEHDFQFPAQLKDLLIEKDEQGQITLSFTPEFLDYMLKTSGDTVNVAAQDWHLLEADESKPSKVSFEGFFADGKILPVEEASTLIAEALTVGQSESTVIMKVVPAKIVNETGKDLGPLEYLGEGRSSFWGSAPEREFNIKKAINERFNGILIPPGAEFSYVEFLGAIEYAGWKQAYTIFKGTQLEKAPAGGVCQISTTVYRAVLDAALEVTEQRSHSLYVIYYQHFGDGLDATVYPGEQDLKFVNNTPNYILMVAQEEGYKEAVIRFFGESDGRSTELYGPYTASNQTEEAIQGIGERLGIGQIAWKYIITHPDGSVETRWLISNYMSPALQHRGEEPGLLSY